MNNAIPKFSFASSQVSSNHGAEELEVAFLKFIIIRSISEEESAGTSGKSA
jgi:hypothetical protein